MRVLGSSVLVKEEKLSEKTESGFVIKGREKINTNVGIVVTVGKGRVTENGTVIPVDVSVGDKVVYTAFAGSPIVDSTKNEEYLIINERDILAILDSDSVTKGE